MTERVSEVEARIGSVKQLSAVITAMRGIAAARSREAGARLEGVRAYAATIGAAIAQALALQADDHVPPGTGGRSDQHLVFVLCAEQGFAGAFNSHVLDAAQSLMARDDGGVTTLLLVGDRGVKTAAERNVPCADAIPMAAHIDEIVNLANRLTELLFDRLRTGDVVRVTIVHSVPEPGQSSPITIKGLIPFDYARFPVASGILRPLITLSPQVLLAQLAEEYVFAELSEALILSYAAENEARMRAMVAARDNVGRKLDELSARARLLRQEQITAEVIELASGASAAS
jgi:F-type H+-transporting ATPase subunit gamma